MMKKIIAATAALVLSATAAQAADEGIYARLDSGWSFSRDAGKDMDDDVGNSPIIGAGVGYRFNQYLRTDLTLGYRGGYDINANTTQGGTTFNFKGDVSAITGMANVYVDVAKMGMFTPYVGAGIGFSRNKVSDTDITTTAGVNGSLEGDTTTSLAWQVGAGVGIDVAPKWTIDVGYRYLDLGEAKSGSTATIGGVTVGNATAKGDLRAHELQAGVRYAF
ncbi:outer membrane protein [Insolitispirillum peregrinum]|uniref:Opacity protein n=1 Tax=Insolitispirillum peregrinum TaxID=80876 RepID=A0A1N7LJP7_9PROT|nr:outer membrane protein [Insolitispirillum peregrinum]SIS74027.1 Opacity protein [Insolitispirillum peregrinum]